MTVSYRRDTWRLVEGVSGDAAELGVAEGRFSQEMLEWPVAFPRVYLVDAWRTLPQTGDGGSPQGWHDRNLARVLERVAPFGDRAVLLRGDTVEAADRVPDGSLALVVVDAWHSFEGTARDAVAWLPKVAPGGVMAFHDYLNRDYGVREAVDEFAAVRGWEVGVIPEDQPEDASGWVRVR